MKSSLCLAALITATSLSATPATYNATTGLGTRLSGGGPTQPQFVDILPELDGPFFDPLESEVQMQDITLVSEVDEGNGFTRLGFTLRLNNTGPGYYEECFIEWEPVNGTWNGVQVGDAHGFMPDLLPNGTTTRPQAFEVRVPTAEKAAAITSILAGKHLRPAAIELHQFTHPPKAVDAATDAQFEEYTDYRPLSNLVTLVFTQTTPYLDALQVGDLMVESAYVYKLSDEDAFGEDQHLREVITAAEAAKENSDGTPQVTQVLKVQSKTVAMDGKVHLNTHSVAMEDFLNVGTLHQGSKQALDFKADFPKRNIYRPPYDDGVLSAVDPVYTGIPPLFLLPELPRIRSPERLSNRGHVAQEMSFRPLHVPFNGIQLSDGKIALGGEMLLEALHVDLKIRFLGPLIPKKAVIKIASKSELTLRLTATANTNNTSSTLIDQEKTLFSLPLAKIVIPMGGQNITITPYFKGKVGAQVNAPTAITIPMHASVMAGCTMSYDATRLPGQQFRYTPYSTIEPLEVSDPLLNDSLALTATAFAEAGIETDITSTFGLTASPYFGARAIGNFVLDPAENPWWNLSFDFQTRGRFAMGLFGINVIDLLENASNLKNFGGKGAGGPVTRGSGAPGGSPPGSFDPVSGGETRWARMAGIHAGSLKVARVLGSVEDVFIGSEGPVVSPPLMRLDPKGNLIWAKGAPFIAAQRLAGTPDGGCVLVSGGQSNTIVWMDGAGNPTAARTFQPQDSNNAWQVSYIGGLLALPSGEVFVAGSIAVTDTNDPFLAKYDAAHNLVFFKRYESLTLFEAIKDICWHPSGDLILCGTADAAPTNGGLLMRITQAGNVVWARRTLSPITYNSVTVAPDGTIYTGGRFARTVTIDWPTMLIARHEPGEGNLDYAVLIGEGMPGTLPLSGTMVSGVSGDHLFSGLTPYDEIVKVHWTPNGVIATGRTPNLSAEPTSAAVTFCMSERLGLRWFTAHDGGDEDGVYDMIITEQGILTAGFTKRFGTVNGDTRPALFMKLPLEGRLDMPGSGHYLQPSIMTLPNFTPIWPGIPTPPQGYQGNEVIAYQQGVQNLDAQIVTPPTFTDVAVYHSPPLQYDPKTGEHVTTNFELWSLQNFPGNYSNGLIASLNADPDHDGLTNFFEYATGLDPWQSNDSSTRHYFNTFGQSMFSFPRIADPGLLYEVQVSNDLLEWTPIYTSTGTANQPGVFEVADPGPSVNGRRFYRLSISQ